VVIKPIIRDQVDRAAEAGAERTMGYNLHKWKERLAERTDLSSHLTHLTRDTDNQSITEVLMSILDDGLIRGSEPGKSFMHGERPAVCFQDAPLSGICQNVCFEDKYREERAIEKIRYRAAGLMFDKRYVYSKGGRPVFYDDPEEAKDLLPPDQWWRIVKLDLSDNDHLIDWTHEREWRAPGDFEFEIRKATVLVPSQTDYKQFIQQCERELPDVLPCLSGIIVMDRILY
jgi:hypothetical protein